MEELFLIISAVFLIQFLYWIIFYFEINKEFKINSTTRIPNAPVSVIVCAHDEEENLREVLPLLLSQYYPEFEIIIVNDCSNDGTYDWLREESRRNSRLRVVNVSYRPEHVNGKKYALTLGIKSAKYDWVLLTDADCQPASNQWIHQMSSAFTVSNSFVIGYSPYLKDQGLLNSFIRFETIMTGIQFFSFSNLGIPYMATGRNLAYRKKIFLDNKGFNGHLHITGGDDDLFVNQFAKGSNTQTVLNVNSIVYSKPKKTWKTYYQQKIRHLAVGKRYKLGTRILLAPFLLSWVLFFPVIIWGLFTGFWQYVLVAALLRWVIMFIGINTFNKKSGEEFESWKIPILDFIFWFYYLVAGFSALITKRIRWKT